MIETTTPTMSVQSQNPFLGKKAELNPQYVECAIPSLG
jgi:hypothetical protein